MWHATACSVAPQDVSAGSTRPHTSSANAQRVRKRQPGGGLIGLGGSPVRGDRSSFTSGSMVGRDASSAWV